MSSTKEPEIFQQNYHPEWDWFEDCFDPVGNEEIYGEASPGNMIHSDVPRRIARHRPGARLLFVLRNPVERAYSQYLYSVARGTHDPSMSFSELIRDRNNEWGRRVLKLGLYHEQLARFERHFSRNQMWIGLFRDLRQDTSAFVDRVLEFLGVDTSVELNTDERHNATSTYPKSKQVVQAAYAVWRPLETALPAPILDLVEGLRSGARDVLFHEKEAKKPKMDPADRAYLRDYYAKPNRRLEEWLGKDLSHWT
jgi:hypothetical protein